MSEPARLTAPEAVALTESSTFPAMDVELLEDFGALRLAAAGAFAAAAFGEAFEEGFLEAGFAETDFPASLERAAIAAPAPVFFSTVLFFAVPLFFAMMQSPSQMACRHARYNGRRRFPFRIA